MFKGGDDCKKINQPYENPQGGDDGSLKTGNAGGRVGCGVVARAN